MIQCNLKGSPICRWGGSLLSFAQSPWQPHPKQLQLCGYLWVKFRPIKEAGISKLPCDDDMRYVKMLIILCSFIYLFFKAGQRGKEVFLSFTPHCRITWLLFSWLTCMPMRLVSSLLPYIPFIPLASSQTFRSSERCYTNNPIIHWHPPLLSFPPPEGLF